MASLTHWDRLVRYVSAKDGQVRYGEPILDSTDDIDKQITAGAAIKVRVLKGSSALTAVPTDEEDEIQQLLGPLSPVEVPIVRCTGLNYKSHIAESGFDFPEYPTLFLKPNQTIANTREPIPIPKLAQSHCDYEGELTIVIGKDARNISEADALNYVAGYVVGNDISCRDWQLDKAKAGMMQQWCFSKSFDKYAPLGPAIVSTKVLGDASGLRIKTCVNGELRQDSKTSDLLFGVRKLVSFLSTGQTLEKGSLIMSGTPGGVGAAMKPNPQFLKNGDEVVVEIEGIGTLRNVMQFE
jgi:2-keto-4-pentenoate hydratase/2-oxohepta-3-ene-1,7-dioic acid hydratase in catechol pathway